MMMIDDPSFIRSEFYPNAFVPFSFFPTLVIQKNGEYMRRRLPKKLFNKNDVTKKGWGV